MAKIRSIHPDACESHTLASIPATAERTFYRLLMHTDDEGRGKFDPVALKSKLYMVDPNVSIEDVTDDLKALETAGLIEVYEVGGKSFYEVTSWGEYQKPKYKSASKVPPRPSPGPDPDQDPVVPPSSPDVPPTEPPSSQREGVGEGEGVTTTGAGKPPRKRDEVFEALIAACRLDLSELTSSARGAANKAAKELREVGATPDGIRARADVHRQRWPNAECTPSSLAKNYAQLGADRGGDDDEFVGGVRRVR